MKGNIQLATFNKVEVSKKLTLFSTSVTVA